MKKLKDIFWFIIETKTGRHYSRKTKRQWNWWTISFFLTTVVLFYGYKTVLGKNRVYQITNKELATRIAIVRENNKALRENNLHLVYINKRLVDINYDITSSELGILIDIRDGGLDEETIAAYADRFTKLDKESEEESKNMESLVVKEENISIDHPIPRLDEESKIIVNAPTDDKGELIHIDKDTPIPPQEDQPDVKGIVEDINKKPPPKTQFERSLQGHKKTSMTKEQYNDLLIGGQKETEVKYVRVVNSREWKPTDQWYGALQ